MNLLKKGKAYTLVGLPYAGKTTLKNELIKRFGFDAVSTDDVIDEKGMEVKKMTQEDWNLVYSESYDRLKKYLQEGKTVIVDIANLKRNERDTARVIAESVEADHTLIYLNTPMDEIRRRREANQHTKERGHLEDVTMNRALEMFEEPTPDEHPVLFNTEMNMNEWVREHIETPSSSSVEGRK